MPPHDGLMHLKEYDIKDSNVELIGTEIDHRVKHASAVTEPAWNNGIVGQQAGLYIWRVEDFAIVPWPRERNGEFYDGDSYVILHSHKVGSKDHEDVLTHEIFFWLGHHTSQDEAGTAAYKTVELDEFLGGVATQYREVQAYPSAEFQALFPHMKILSGGVRTGFRHVDAGSADAKEKVLTLLRIFRVGGKGSTVAHEVQPTWQSLDDDDVFVLDAGDKIWVWQGAKCSPMEKAKAAQVVNDMTLAKHIDVEVIARSEPRSHVILSLLGGKDVEHTSFHSPRPVESSHNLAPGGDAHAKKLFRLSDASGSLVFNLTKEGSSIGKSDLDTNDVFLLDIGRAVWIWRGKGASQRERAMWISVAQEYLRRLAENGEGAGPGVTPFASVVEGNESPAFFKAIQV